MAASGPLRISANLEVQRRGKEKIEGSSIWRPREKKKKLFF